MRIGRLILLLGLIALVSWAGAGLMFPLKDANDWTRGTFEGTSEVGGNLELATGIDTGNYTSRVFDAGDRYPWPQFMVESDLNGGTVAVTVATSDDDFATVKNRNTVQLTGGLETIDINVSEERWVRVNLSMTRGASSPVIRSMNVTMGGDLHFVLRQDSCLEEEQELFSFSNKSNAHAGDPGYWDAEHVCASGIQDAEYTNVCTGDNREIMSFFGTEVNTTHLSTDSQMFDYKLCTRALSIGVRNSCPNTTVTIASIFKTPEGHLAEPGVYGNQLCGGLINTVTAAMQFHLGPDDDIYLPQDMSQSENPPTGRYTNLPDGGYIVAENDSMVAGMVAGENTRLTEINYDEAGADHVFNMTQSRTKDVSFYLPFTRGNHLDVEDRRLLIQRDQFLEKINPNFGLQFAEHLLVRLTLGLTDIDIVNDLSLSGGFYDLTISNMGTTNGRPRVAFNVSTG